MTQTTKPDFDKEARDLLDYVCGPRISWSDFEYQGTIDALKAAYKRGKRDAKR